MDLRPRPMARRNSTERPRRLRRRTRRPRRQGATGPRHAPRRSAGVARRRSHASPRTPLRHDRRGNALDPGLRGSRSMTLREDVYVVGAGMSRFGGPPVPLDQRIMTAAREAIDDSGMPYTDVQALYLGTVLSPPTLGQGVVKDLGLTGLPVVRVENASATGGAAFYEAVQAV